MIKKFINITIYLTLISFVYSQERITISAVGDLMVHSTQFKYAHVENDSFNFKPVFKYVKNIFDKSDFVIGNLETVIGGSKMGYSGYPLFNSPVDFLDGIKYAGFDLVSFANNHSLDRGVNGLKNTPENLNLKNIHYTGAHLNEREKDSLKIYTVNEISFAILGYSYGSNQNPLTEKNNFHFNFINAEKIKKEIKRYREAGTDIIIMFYHFGNEYQKSASPYQIDVVNDALNFGADVIIGCHPHVPQPIEIRSSKYSNIDSVVVAYSLGNFISNQRWRYSDGGPILNITIEKNHVPRKFKLVSVDVIPTWVFKGETEKGSEYIIFPSQLTSKDFEIEYFSNSDYSEMNQSFNDISEIMIPKNSKLVKVYWPYKTDFKDISIRGYDLVTPRRYFSEDLLNEQESKFNSNFLNSIY